MNWSAMVIGEDFFLIPEPGTNRLHNIHWTEWGNHSTLLPATVLRKLVITALQGKHDLIQIMYR